VPLRVAVYTPQPVAPTSEEVMLNPPLSFELAEAADSGQIAPTPSISWSESLLPERKTSEKKGVHPGTVARPLSSVASISAVPFPTDPETDPA
jgi:hypothetical protein